MLMIDGLLFRVQCVRNDPLHMTARLVADPFLAVNE